MGSMKDGGGSSSSARSARTILDNMPWKRNGGGEGREGNKRKVKPVQPGITVNAPAATAAPAAAAAAPAVTPPPAAPTQQPGTNVTEVGTMGAAGSGKTSSRRRGRLETLLSDLGGATERFGG